MKVQTLHKVREMLEVLERIPDEPGDLTSILQHIAQTAQTFFGADDCVIFAINPISGRFITSLTIAGNLLEEKVSFEQPRPKGIAQEVLRREILVVEDLEAMLEYQSPFTRLEGIRSFVGLALRMKYRQKPLGVLYLNFRQAQQFSPDDRELFQFFTDQASFILQETWLLQRYQEVAHIGEEINHELATIDILFQKLQKHINEILDTSYAFLLAVYQPQANTLDLYIQEEGHSIVRENDPLEGACQYVIETKKPLFIRQMSKEGENLPFQPVEIDTGTEPKASLIFVPLVLRSLPLGVLSIQHPQPNVYDQEDLYILQLLANHIALALNNMRLYSNLSQLNETGQLLTQLLESEQTLQETVDKIRDATQADVVVLYPYDPIAQHFAFPARIAGTLLDSSLKPMFPSRPNDIASLTWSHKKPIFAKESAFLYRELQGDIPIQQGNFQERENIRSTAALPLQTGDEIVGILFVNFRQTQRFDAAQKLFIEGLAHYAAIAIKNAQVFGTLSLRRVRELEILQNIDRELSRTLELEPVLSTLLRLAHEQVPAEEACVLLYNTRKQALEIPAAIGLHAETRKKITLPLQEAKGITLWVLEHKKPARVDNVHRDPQWRDLYIKSIAATVSELDVPLIDGEEVVGILNFESTREGAFRQEDEDFLLTLAGQAVLAVKNAQAYEREKRLAEEGRVLNEISKQITSQLDPVRVFDLILEKALELTHSTTGNLMLYDPRQNDLWMATERGVAKDKKGQRQSLDQGVVGHVARTKQLLNIDLSRPPWNEVNLDFIPGTRSELAVPMLAGSDLHGVLNIESLSADNFSESDERLLKGLADLTVIALQNAQAYEREKRLYEREKRLAAEAQVLNEISKEITSQLDLAHVFDLILEKALALTHSTLGSLHLYDSDLHDLHMVVERGVTEGKKVQRQRLNQGIVGYVAADKQLRNIGDVSQHPWNEIYREAFPKVRSELAVPMLAGDNLRGVLNVESPYPNNFSERDERLLQGLADLAVIALQNAQAYEREKRLAEEGQVLNEISKEITSQLDLAHVFDLILEKALELTHSTLGSLHLYAPEPNDLHMVAERGVAKDKKGQRQRLDQGIVGYVAKYRQLQNVGNVTQSPWNKIYLEFFPGVCSELAVPMLAGNELRGVLNVESLSPNNFTESDERLLQGLADLAVIALQNAQAYEREKRLVSEGQLLNTISKEITSQLDLAHVFDLIVEKALELTHSKLGALLLYDSDLNDLGTVAAHGLAEDKKGIRLSLQQGIVGHVARNKQLINADLSNPAWKKVHVEFVPGMCSELAVPMLAGNELRGVLYVESSIPNNFNESDERLLQGLADMAVVALQNAQAYDQAKQEIQRFELLYQAGQELGKISELTQLEQTYDIILHITEKYCDGQVVIRRYEEETQELVAVGVLHHQYSPPFPRMKLDEGINGQVARERRTIILYDTNKPPQGVVPAKLSDATVHSLIITPIMSKERYYGNLGLGHKEVGHFRDADAHFLEGVAQQLASIIYRLETVQERHEFEQRALSTEEMSSIGQSAFEVTHRLGNDLGLIELYVTDIEAELEGQNATNSFVSKKLKNILQSVQAVLSFSGDLKQELAKLGAKEEMAGEQVLISPRVLLEEASVVPILPPNIQIYVEIEEDVAEVRVFHSLVADILRNLVANAIQAMPEGGKITLRARNANRSVALEVSDTGVGIPPQELSNIFDLFFSTKGSSGFGLWSARRNALKNHGDLKVESKPDQGTTFTLLLPRINGTTIIDLG